MENSLGPVDVAIIRPAMLVVLILSATVAKPAAAFCEDRNDRLRVAPGASPYPVGTACAPDSAGVIDVTVAAQTGNVVPASALPDPVSLCLDANGLTDCEERRHDTDLLNADDASGFADIVVEYFDSGNGSLSCPEGQGGAFPPPASSARCVPFSVVLGDDAGPTSDYLSLPEGSFVTVGFVNGVIIDGPGNDVLISEVGNAAENAEIYVSSLLSTNPSDFTLLGVADGATLTSFDLASIGFTGQVRSVKVLSLENGGFPTAPGFDLAHVEAVNFSAVPLSAAISVEKLTNGNQADGANDPDVPRIEPGATITWAYEVMNTGGDTFAEAELTVTDNQPGVTPILDTATDDGDMILSPGETWTYTATAQVLDLTGPPAGITVVPGCNDDRNTYENTGRVDIAGTVIFDEDLSHYCNSSDFDGDGISDNEDNCILVPNGPLNPDAGGNSQLDTDDDGYGNVCDPDLNNDLRVDFADLAKLKSVFFTADPDADLNGDQRVDFADLAIQKQMFFGPPGPSSQAP